MRLRLERSPVHDGPDMAPRALTVEQAEGLAAYIHALQQGQDLGRPVFTGPLCNPMFWC